MTDLRKQFSLEYLGNAAPARPQGEEELNRATVLYGGPILDVLRTMPNTECTVHDLVAALQTRKIDVGSFEEFLGAINRLATLGFVTIAERNPLGNHRVRLGSG